MKTSKLLPKLTAPVQRSAIAIVSDQFFAVTASTHCDIATRQCFPFAGDDAE
ncbi:MAG: anacyclamide/piricyclamide family prenylated cyclic peptide [Snowella sp.]|jgi:prenylated cyclic peptide (anacyclamide/piricyclamide family)|nr:MAG: anacyclamide/piricyclamide family prenylated cyclic peptide [Snowella sp.]